jgi:hypothetical protein
MKSQIKVQQELPIYSYKLSESQDQIQKDIRYEKYRRFGNYALAIVSGAGGVVGTASMLIPILSPPGQIQYANQDYTAVVFVAGLIAFLGSSVGLCKSLNEAAKNNEVINNLEKMLDSR